MARDALQDLSAGGQKGGRARSDRALERFEGLAAARRGSEIGDVLQEDELEGIGGRWTRRRPIVLAEQLDRRAKGKLSLEGCARSGAGGQEASGLQGSRPDQGLSKAQKVPVAVAHPKLLPLIGVLEQRPIDHVCPFARSSACRARASRTQKKASQVPPCFSFGLMRSGAGTPRNMMASPSRLTIANWAGVPPTHSRRKPSTRSYWSAVWSTSATGKYGALRSNWLGCGELLDRLNRAEASIAVQGHPGARRSWE